MNQNNDDLLGVPGVPGAGQPKSNEKQTPEPAPEPESADGEQVFDRPGETGLGVPLSSLESRELSEEEEALVLARLSEEERAEAFDLIDEMSQEYQSFRLPEMLRKPVAGLILLMIALFGVYLTTSIFDALSSFAKIEPEALRYLAIGLLAFFVLLALFACMRLFGVFLKLESNQQIRPEVLTQLAERGRMHQAIAREQFGSAVTQVKAYLAKYPDLHEAKARRKLQRLGISESVTLELSNARDALLDDAKRGDERAWLARFERDFQRHLDEAARVRIKRASWQAGLATAATPNKAVDMALVIAIGTTLVADLCRIYNVKADRFSMVLVLGRVVTSAFVAGNLQDLGKEGATVMSDQLQGAMGVIGAKLVGGVASRAAEGAINGMLVRRLGRTTRQMLQAVRSDPKA